MTYRDFLQKLIYKLINPFIHGMIKCGITPNAITTIGLLLNIAAACIFIYGGLAGEKYDFSYIGWGGLVILFAGLFDMIDGRLARLGHMESTFGALYDSVLDRYSELCVFFGICAFTVLQGYAKTSIIAFLALIGSLMVSYVRARAEGLGLDCKVGLMQRPERVVLTSVGALACGLTAHFTKFNGTPDTFDPMSIFAVILGIVAVLSNLTAFYRLEHCRKELSKRMK